MMHSARRRRNRGRALVWALLGLVLGVILVWAIWWTRKGPRPENAKEPGGKSPAAVELTLTEYRDLVQLKNASISYLENGESNANAPADEKGAAAQSLALATSGFIKLREQLPDELLPLRNLAIARLLALRGPDPEPEKAQAAAAALLAAEDYSPQACWLAAKVHVQLADTQGSREQRTKAIELLERAAADPSAPLCVAYALYEAGKDSRSEDERRRTAAAIGKAYAQQPGNLALLRFWLAAQAYTKDPTIVETIAQAHRAIQPIEIGLKKKNLDADSFLDAARDAAEKQDWRAVARNATFFNNAIYGEEYAKSDLQRVNVHPLDLTLYEFSDALRARAPQLPPEPAAIAVQWVETPNAAVLHEQTGVRDLMLVDFDVDGKLDVAMLKDNEVVVLGRQGDEGDWKVIASAPVPGGSRILLAADLDRDRVQPKATPNTGAPAPSGGPAAAAQMRDADPELVVCGDTGIVVLRNDLDESTGRRTLTQVDAGLAGAGAVRCATLVDFDHDGDLDLVAATHEGIRLYVGLGNNALGFRDVTALSTLPPADFQITSLAAVDFDRDVDIDLMVSESSGKPAGFLENLRHGQFRWQPLPAGFEALSATSDLAVLEADGNASWDLAAAGPQGVQVVLTATPHPPVVNSIRSERVGSDAQRGILTLDFDNDGFQDLLCWNDSRIVLYRGHRDGTFSVAAAPGAGLTGIQRCDVGDVDRDGDLDIIVAHEHGVTLYENQGGNRNHWVTVLATGDADEKGRANHDGLGSLVELKAGLLYQAQVAKRRETHFGIGDRERADVLRIVWTNGVPQALANVPTDAYVVEPMVLKGSCPYVYAWDGEKFTFVTDCLWAAPLGLQTSAGTLAPCRPWEYLLLPGDVLQPKDGQYLVQLTEELWEAGYFDQVELLAVDHPADVEVYSNEKVGPPEIAAFQMHTVRQRRTPVAAHDSHGRDVLDMIRHRDGRFLRGFDRLIRQGLAEDHYLELDLGPLKAPQQIKLFLTGWIFPTDTSLNVAFSQNPELDGPRLPSIWVPDAEGHWRERVAYMGFPGGKTKTIVVDLSGAFLTNDYRVRIQTSAEIYWDEAFFTVDDAPAELRTTVLPVVAAELAYRGFSEPFPARPNAPQTYDHERVRTDPKWPPMRGHFTRYGDVTPLLRETDHQLAVLGSGDAVTVRFAVPDRPPPAGWKRDFVLHSVGWDKDADLNTVYGQSSEPLPFVGMSNYPYPEDYPDSPPIREYFRRYQTREQDLLRFWRWPSPGRP